MTLGYKRCRNLATLHSTVITSKPYVLLYTELGSAHGYHPCADPGGAKMNTCCPPKPVPSAARFFPRCRLTVQRLRDTVSEDSPGQLTGKPAGVRPDYRGRWCADCSLLWEGAVLLADNVICPGTPDYLGYVWSSPHYQSQYFISHLEYTGVEERLEKSGLGTTNLFPKP
ncbi:COMT methyltransferase, partial [Polyodon spathula]|nr:COMT methyltransferase [Polyodon spathula]